VAAEGRSRRTTRRRTTHSGVPAMSRAARPESTSCSATATRPLPPTSRNTPQTAAVVSWVRVMAKADRPRTSRIAATSTSPASRKRVPMATSGGRPPSTTNLIARYVEPQTR
jgi:hypothetical protein